MYRHSALLVLLTACTGHPRTNGDTATTGDTGADDTDTGADTGADTSGETGDTGGDTDTAPIEVPADNLSNALGTCADLFVEPPEYPNQLFAGSELQRYTLHEPEAVCNDGTRAVLYVRGFTDEALRDVWEIHLQGGGGCSTWTDCALRWCGAGYYDASKMSSGWTPEEIGAVGVMDAEAGNFLSGANHAYFYYCSSDSWGGQGTMSLDVPSGEDTGGEDTAGTDLPDLPDYTMFRRGHTIVQAGIDELEAGLVGDGGEVMPPLSDASIVLLNGTSGGSSGARTHADWLTERLAANGTRVLGVFDAAITPRTEDWPEAYREAVDAQYLTAWEHQVAVHDVPPFVDESCAAHYGGTEEAWRCQSAPWVLFNHITTPFFVRQDLRDIGEFAESFELPEDDHEVAVAATLAALARVPTEAVEAAEISVTPGAYGPNCGQHVAMETVDWWRQATVEDAEGTPTTFQGAVAAWYQGNPVSIVDEPVAGEGDGPRSLCFAVY